MPKLKVHRGAKKRIKLTARNKMVRSRAYGNHFLAKKSSARKRVIARPKQLSKGNKRNMKRALGV